ncbi:hypothetical protein [Microbispora sp. NPDC049633]|uniref:hypothetical protein n=1 Tax=Microbispora sp. NPDC049633 TaxID=3154355 RepID=UPI0034334D1A
MGAIPAFLLRHTVTIRPLLGEGSFGPKHGDPVTVPRCFVDEKRRLVRGPTGSEVVSEATVYAPRGTVCPVGSLVTLPSGRKASALAVGDLDGGGLPTPDHLEIALT